MNANQVPTVMCQYDDECVKCDMIDSLSPRNVPAATIAKPIHSPQTTPHSSATSSWPNSGGKEMMNSMTIGISHPAGRSRSFSEKGRSFYNDVSGCDAGDATITTHFDGFVVVYRQQDCAY